MAENQENKSNLAFQGFLLLEYPIAMLKTAQFLKEWLWELGYDISLEGETGQGFTVFEKVVSVAEEISGGYQDIIESDVRVPKNFSDIGKLIKLGGKLGGAGKEIYELIGEQGSEADIELDQAFFEDLIKIVILKTHQFHFPVLYDSLVLATVIRPGTEKVLSDYLRDQNGRIIRFPHAISELDPSRLHEFIRDPVAVFKQQYLQPPTLPTDNPSEDDPLQDPQLKAISDKFFKRLRKLLAHSDANVVYGLKPADWLDFDDPLIREVNARTLTFWFEFDLKGDKLELGTSMAFVRNPDNSIAMAVIPFGGWQRDFSLYGWDFSIDATQFSEPFLINGDVEPEPGDIATRFEFSAVKGSADQKAYIFGGEKSTRLELGIIRSEVGFALPVVREEIGALLEFTDSKLVIMAPPRDGFLFRYLPKKGIDVNFDLGIGWSNLYGFYIKGGAGLEVEFAKHIKFLKILELTAVQIGLHTSNREFRLYSAINAEINLGPVNAKVNSLGMQLIWIPDRKFLESPDQETLQFDFKPPKGVGIKVEAKAVNGGGFLFFDKDKGQYAGVAELEVEMFDVEVVIKAVGIINTKAPDGSEGFSFLLLLSGEFYPVQLGAGFFWSGIGGLIGINRTMDTDALRLGVRDKTLDHILFPEDPLKNAKQIITSANSVFPMQEDRYVFGIMAILGWGKKNFVTLELGILVELPEPVKLAIVGVVKASVSKERNGKELSIIKLQVNFAGIIDFDRKYFSFDASLYDSSMLTFRFEGDLAIRVQWGEEDCFLLSVGGFHPDFNEIPQSFPSMTRLLMPLVDRKNAQIILTFYLAITPNTFQIGAGVFFSFKLFKVRIKGGFSFDALFFSRSKFITLVTAELEIKAGSKTLVGVKFNGNFSGTTPWNINGTVKFKVLFWSFSKCLDKTYGETVDTRLDAIEVLPELVEELEDNRNWQQITPASVNLLVSARDVVDSSILVHPTSGISVNQSLLPLTIRLNKLGAQPVKGANRFDLELSDSNGQKLTVDTIKDQFPPAMYLELSDEEKLSRKSYERMPSGIAMQQAEQIKLGSALEKPMVYEKRVFDDKQRTSSVTTEQLTQNIFGQLSAGTTVARSEIAIKRQGALAAQDKPVQTAANDYVIVYDRDLSVYQNWARSDSETEAIQMMEELLEQHPELQEQVSVVPAYELD